MKLVSIIAIIYILIGMFIAIISQFFLESPKVEKEFQENGDAESLNVLHMLRQLSTFAMVASMVYATFMWGPILLMFYFKRGE